MTPIIPKHSVRDADRATTRLWLDHEHVPDGEYDIRGGLCWPIPTPEGGITGFALVLGRHLPSGVYHWLDETRWTCVDHVVENGKIAFEGIAPWLGEAWRKFYVASWYYAGDRDLAWRYRKQMHRSDHIHPMPHVSEVDWKSDDYPVGVMRELMTTERLSIPKDSDIFRTERTWATTPQGTPLPPQLMALCSALLGLEQWRRDARRQI